MATVIINPQHFQFSIPEGSTSVRKNIFIQLDDGAPAIGHDEGDFTVSNGGEFAYFRDDASAAVDAKQGGTNALANASTLGTWESAKIKEVSSTLMPGWYEIGFPDAAFLHSANVKAQTQVTFMVKADDISVTQPILVHFTLTKEDLPRTAHQFVIPENSTSVLVDIFLEKNDGSPATGLTKTEFEVGKESLFSYHRSDAAAAVDSAFDGTDTIGDTSTLGTWITNSFKEIDATKMPGHYELGLPNAALVESSEGNSKVTFHIKADKDAEVQDCRLEIRMTGGASGGSGSSAAAEVRLVEKANAVNVRRNVYLTNSSTGLAATALTKTDFTVANGAEFAYYRGDASAAVDAKFDGTTALGDATTLGTFESATIKEISSSLMPGWYEVSFPNALFIINQESGVKARTVTCLIKPEDDSSVSPVNIRFDLLRSIAR